jgi:hypothetical protein
MKIVICNKLKEPCRCIVQLVVEQYVALNVDAAGTYGLGILPKSRNIPSLSCKSPEEQAGDR